MQGSLEPVTPRNLPVVHHQEVSNNSSKLSSMYFSFIPSFLFHPSSLPSSSLPLFPSYSPQPLPFDPPFLLYSFPSLLRQAFIFVDQAILELPA